MAHNLHHPEDLQRIDLDHVPSAVFTDPYIASVGRTEQDCRESALKYVVGKADYSDVAYGWALQYSTGFCKIIVDADTDLILGGHIMGPQASTLIQTLVLAVEFKITASDLSQRPFWIHPALTEVIDNALRNIAPGGVVKRLDVAPAGWESYEDRSLSAPRTRGDAPRR